MPLEVTRNDRVLVSWSLTSLVSTNMAISETKMTECNRSFMIHCYCPIQNYMCILYVFYTIQQYINQMFDGVPIKNQQQP